MKNRKIIILPFCNGNLAEVYLSALAENRQYELEVIPEAQIDAAQLHTLQSDLVVSIANNDTFYKALAISALLKSKKILVFADRDPSLEIIKFYKSSFNSVLLNPRANKLNLEAISLFEKLDQQEKELAKLDILRNIQMSGIIGKSPSFMEVLSKIQMIAKNDTTVLIQGETGVGKEVCARAVHYLSPRANYPFIAVNCGTLPINLIDNELFGHQKGAFTDARTPKEGLVAEAENGTLFLDEIDALGIESQSKLLRLLQDKTYRPLGDTKDRKANIRVIAATNVNLKEKIAGNGFRSDLFYRFTFPLVVPPLRERGEDILRLASHFLQKYQKEYGTTEKTFCPSAERKMLNYAWPGNVRELENIIQQALLLSRDEKIIANEINIPVPVSDAPIHGISFQEAKQQVIEEFERNYVSGLLAKCEGNISQAARVAGKDRADLSRLVKKYQLG